MQPLAPLKGEEIHLLFYFIFLLSGSKNLWFGSRFEHFMKTIPDIHFLLLPRRSGFSVYVGFQGQVCHRPQYSGMALRAPSLLPGARPSKGRCQAPRSGDPPSLQFLFIPAVKTPLPRRVLPPADRPVPPRQAHSEKGTAERTPGHAWGAGPWGSEERAPDSKAEPGESRNWPPR